MPGPSENSEIQSVRAEAQQRSFNADDVEYTNGSSIRAEETPPRKSKSTKQMVDFKGFPLSTEDGNPLSTDKQVYTKYEYGADRSPSVILNSENFQKEGRSTSNKFSKKFPAAAPVEEIFSDQSEVSRSLLGINRETTQQGLFGNVSTYGLDEKDWRVDGTSDRNPAFWYRRPSSSGNYFETRFDEDTVNSAIAINSMPSPFTPPGKPGIQTLLITPGEGTFTGWGQYLNSIIGLYLMKYMVENFDAETRTKFNLDYLLDKYPPITQSDGSFRFDELYWDKIWLDIQQNRFGDAKNYPLLPKGTAYNLIEPTEGTISLEVPRTAALWGEGGDTNVIISAADPVLPTSFNVTWNRFFFSITRVYYPQGNSDNYGHYRLQTNPERRTWEDYFGLNWDYLRTDLKNWSFTIHESTSTVSQLERDLKLPYFVLSELVPDPTNIFSTSWPSAAIQKSIRLPTSENKIGGTPGVNSEVSIKSIRSFRYQPGRISGFTYGSKASEIGAGPGTTIEWGVENDTDAYFFRLADGADFQIVRRSIVALEPTQFLEDAGYIGDATTTVIRNGYRQYETVIEQKNMNGDPLNGEGESGYIIDPDTVTMYKIEFGWYGAIGARFYAYIPTENDQCRWVVLHTLVIENQLGQPCLGDPFFYFRYRLIVGDSSKIRVNQFLYKFGASYYIDGYDEGTLYSSFAKSKRRLLPDPKFTSTKNYLNAIDYTTLIGVKPKQYLYNRYGSEIYNKKEIFPRSISIYSKEDAEIKIIRQKACPEFAYFHQEGYNWPLLPEYRRVKGKFSIKQWETSDSSLGIDIEEASTYSATMSGTATLPTAIDPSNPWRPASIISNNDFRDNVINDQLIRLAGDDLFQLTFSSRDFTNPSTPKFKLMRIKDNGPVALTTSQQPALEKEQVHLPFTYAPIGDYVNGYDVEFDYFRRDQTLISDIDIISDEFYLFWVGGSRSGIDSSHAGTMRVGFAWPNTSGSASNNILHPDRRNNGTWGIQTPNDITATSGDEYEIWKGSDSNGNEFINYDGEKFYEGLPVDFVGDYNPYCLWIETNTHLTIDTKGLEVNHRSDHQDLFDLQNANISVPGAEGGECQGLGFKAGREDKDAVVSNYSVVNDDGTTTNKWYLESLDGPWPSLGASYQVNVKQLDGQTTAFTVPRPVTRNLDDGTKVYLLEIGSGANPPSPLSSGESVKVIYEILYIGLIDKQNKVTSILTSSISSVDFSRIFVQCKQGASMGGMWIGQKTPQGVVLDPFTPHASTVNVRHGVPELSGQNKSGTAPTDGALKVITTRTQNDEYGLSTAPTVLNSGGEKIETTRQSVHYSAQKCGSFLSRGGTDPAGILTPSDYPIRWLTNDQTGLPLGTFYVSKNESVEISLEGIFNVNAESIVNSDDANLATIFIARSLNNHDPVDSKKEIYLTLNYDEQ